MEVKSLELINFRNYKKTKVEFKSGINFVVGKNAQGKTNLLESLYLLSVGKSPKNSRDKQIILFNETNAKIDIKFSTRVGDKNIQMYLDKNDKKSIKINNLNILKLTELVGILSVVYFSPDEMKLIKEVPEDRRTFLDISISQFDKPYMYNLMKYNRILKMRNQILKSFDSVESKKEQLHLFTPQLIETAEKIIEKRLLFIENLKIIAKNIHKQITDTENLDINYSYQKKENSSIKDDLTNQFNSSLEKDLELGYTTIGPHRDDIVFKINDKDCKYFASQGQQRTVSLVVKLSLMEIIKQEIGEYPVLLLDDVLSELDGTRQDRLLKMTTKYQTIISCVSIPNLTEKFNVIHVENGQIS
ncbi:MAG: DNA replication/repair protein RecF [Clostridiales bacterium]|nr:DNA replication/repair protein RecF [Clostridiales bacterium]